MSESCFGKAYSSSATECSDCEVKKECKLAMSEDDRKKNVEMPCFKDEYVSENYACRKSCYVRVECRAAALGEELPIVFEETPPPAKVATMTKTPITEGEPVVKVEAPVVVTPSVVKVTPPALVDPVDSGIDGVPELVIEGRMGKKAIVRAALRAHSQHGGVSSEDIVQYMIDLKQVEDSEVNRKKNKEYVSMCVSELKKMEDMVIERVGGKYVLSGESN